MTCDYKLLDKDADTMTSNHQTAKRFISERKREREEKEEEEEEKGGREEGRRMFGERREEK